MIGVYDQTPLYTILDYDALKREFRSDAEFVHEIEAVMPPGAMIYQMPHVLFPESGRVCQMGESDHLRAYLHLRQLHWSAGAMIGRPEGIWQDEMAGKSLPELVPSLAYAGFSGIYVNRTAYADQAAAVQSELARIVGISPQVNSDGKLLFFNLTAYVKKLRSRCTERDWESKRELVLHPLTFSWTGGFSYAEGKFPNSWRWCSSSGKLIVNNPASRNQEATLKMGFNTACPGTYSLRIDGDLLRGALCFKSGQDVILEKLTIAPGRHVLTLACDAPRFQCPDPRIIVFRVTNFTARDADE